MFANVVTTFVKVHLHLLFHLDRLFIMDRVVTTTHTLTLKLMKGRMQSVVICMMTLSKFLQRDRAVGYAGNSLIYYYYAGKFVRLSSKETLFSVYDLQAQAE